VVDDWTPSLSEAGHGDGIRKIKRFLLNGDAYQINLTFKLVARQSVAGASLFRRLRSNQDSDLSALILADEFSICSASPELFFERVGSLLTSRPMKGTAARGLTADDDDRRAVKLRNSIKDRAENLMIVDMIRNDMGKVAEPGSVEVTSLFDIERFPTVLQMTSTVQCRTQASFTEILTAMFPCASVTGAPKVRAMEIIKELEAGPRGVYTGSIGYLLPDGRARFNVAIRTAWVDLRTDQLEYGVGSGVVWDSNSSGEYDECLLKSKVLSTDRPEFDLLETMLWEEGTGFFLFGRHLRRLERSAAYFGFSVPIGRLVERLEKRSESMPGRECRVRVMVSRDGGSKIECHPIEPHSEQPTVRVELAERCVDSSNVFLYHKTTHRSVYESALISKNCADVLLYNERGEITESTKANVVADIGGRLVTPPVESGLLAGTFRQSLLETGDIEERVVTVEEFVESKRVFLINSVQKWMACELISD